MTVFVFSGGGLNGAAQVGMLEELYARGITPDAVVGVSVGALNAVSLAYDPLEWSARMHGSWKVASTTDLFRGSSSRAVWAVIRRRSSVDSGLALANFLRSDIPVTHLEDTAIPVRIGTVVLATGEMRWHASGSAHDILQASCAIPGILPPVLINGQLHVDGGVCSPVPVAAAIDFAPTRIVVLDVTHTLEDERVEVADPTALKVLLRSFEAARRRVAAAEMAALTPDLEVIYIRYSADAGPTMGTNAASLAKIASLVAGGRSAARAVLDIADPTPNSVMSLASSSAGPTPERTRLPVEAASD
jgi:NTE family protein